MKKEYTQTLKQLEILSENQAAIEEMKRCLELTESASAVVLEARPNVHLKSQFFGNFENLFTTFKTLALADLNKQLETIDLEIKKRLA